MLCCNRDVVLLRCVVIGFMFVLRCVVFGRCDLYIYIVLCCVVFCAMLCCVCSVVLYCLCHVALRVRRVVFMLC